MHSRKIISQWNLKKKCYKCKSTFSFSYEKKTIHEFKQNTGITLHLVKQKKKQKKNPNYFRYALHVLFSNIIKSK